MKNQLTVIASVIFCLAMVGCNGGFNDAEKNLFDESVIGYFRSPDHSDAIADKEITLVSSGKSGEYESKIVRVKWKNDNQSMGTRTLCSYVHFSNDSKFGKWRNIIFTVPYGVDGKGNPDCAVGKVYDSNLPPNQLHNFNEVMKNIGYTGKLPQ